MRHARFPARLLAAIGAAALMGGTANAQSVQDFEKAMAGGWAVAPGPASGGKACHLDLDAAKAADGLAVKADDCGGPLGGAKSWAIAGNKLALYGAGKAVIVALGGNQLRLTGKTAAGEEVELVRPQAPHPAAAPARASAPAAAKGPTEAQLVAAFGGEWRVQESAGGKSSACRLDLRADAAHQRLFVTDIGCTGDLAGIAGWAIAGGKLVLRTGAGKDVALLGGNQFRLTGKTTGGHDLVLARRAMPRAPGLGNRGCAYLGYSATCATTLDLVPPAIPEKGTAPLGVLVEMNLRAEPSMSARVVGVVPAKACVAADSCKRTDTGLWCHAHAGKDGGWLKQEVVRERRWLVVAFRGHC